MLKIVMLIPYEEMRSPAEAAFTSVLAKTQGHENTSVSYRIIRTSATAEVVEMKLDADVLIARGALAYDLQRMYHHIPVVELRIGSVDWVEVFAIMRAQYHADRAAIIGSPNMIRGAEHLAAQFGIEMRGYDLESSDRVNVERSVKRAIADGFRMVVGGGWGSAFARQCGIEGIAINSSEASIADAVIMSLQVASASRQHREDAVRLQTMLDNAYEGLIAVDRNNHITAFNAAAQNLLGAKKGAWYIGQPLHEAIYAPQMLGLVRSKESYLDKIIHHDGTYLSFRKISTLLNGEVTGCVLTFLNESQIHQKETQLRQSVRAKGRVARYHFEDINSTSIPMRDTVAIAKSYAATNSNILIGGESGVGKELFSQSIHNASQRAEQPFVAVNCGAIPENLLESELFGYVAGAFTGATKEGKMGLFEQAHRGTLFLDEIGELPLSMQSRLLRVLQEREITRLGDDKVIPVDVRMIAATNRNLWVLVQNNSFREDLYYRLNVLRLQIPPLRDRTSDIPDIVTSSVAQFRAEQQLPPLALTPQAMACMQAHKWHGNVRELRNFCERLAVLSHHEMVVERAQIEELLNYEQEGEASIAVTEPTPMPTVPPSTRQIGDAQVVAALLACKGNRTQAAKQLGMSRATLWRRIKEME